ncbi:HlyD family efflux transporter periplasmic adaptor subunit [Comamonas endophytica]|uniref:HlyD family efflux transporter periplasmic adaptor subunit n=1 Tax=Comamonas endophytica TaxID=2949090 RepID=A0ABY6GEU5_9BURK|nr:MULTISPECIES: HlyD family efflux transporter periplasmic adaptor subunit [unclassified Acidovorax]MCD2513136.1 HlyD family efflux transporter periplasmic adaptor subunit [Acidovorax sp. D4N7]UYG53514.1 HlyD family efflux transporter periplasmic adaptor subunit [Acidovorax sp. 5MLIR]
MWSDRFSQDEDARRQAHVRRLQNVHRGNQGWLLGLLFVAVLVFGVWATMFRIDEVARAGGEVIARSRVQVIQSVDGGVLEQLLVREGDRVEPGQLLARLEQTRFGASVGEVEARLFGLQAKIVRLRAEVTGEGRLAFPADLVARSGETARVEEALFRQRRQGIDEELRTLRVAVDLAQKEQRIVDQLYADGDASGSEVLRVQRGFNEAQARLANRRNKFLEDARIDLAKAEDDIAQGAQTLTRRKQEQSDSVFTAVVPGIVKNIRVTTVGGVLRAGEELMQIVPVDDELMVEAKVSPADISRVVPGLEATLRFDTFDYTIFGGVKGRVAYVSADSLKEETSRGVDTYYRVRIEPSSLPVTTTTGRTLEILPGMTAQVDIRTGERSLMDYLLKPLRKTMNESFGER